MKKGIWEFIKNRIKLIAGVALIALGITSMLFINYTYYFGAYEDNNTYGGDAYTGIQNAAAQTANNVYNVGELLEEMYYVERMYTGIVFVVAGSLLSLYDIANNKKPKKENV